MSSAGSCTGVRRKNFPKRTPVRETAEWAGPRPAERGVAPFLHMLDNLTRRIMDGHTTLGILHVVVRGRSLQRWRKPYRPLRRGPGPAITRRGLHDSTEPCSSKIKVPL
jgi:hypothetical protein